MNTVDKVPHPSDFGRRVATRRRQLNLSREDVADRAGSTVGYITYVEERLPGPGTGFLVRLADALETTVQDLMGMTADLPSGEGHAGARPRLERIDEKECWVLLGDHGVGRIAIEVADTLDVIPVNYRVIDGRVLFMTTATSALGRAAAAGAEIAFEEDHVDEAFRQGWSVLLVGPVRIVSDSAESQSLRVAAQAQAQAQSWAGEGRDTPVLLLPHRVTGRRILVPGAPGTADGAGTRER
ncbi:pyridoxamine 5'-phosphate oxidase family protein [Streptomyces sp. NPDC002225]|uniref:pyridoxamine 5'-phosphate oxidase family protein n=1 Tax=Streptomyces sp. NPDC002225 TaxID=3154413 RepID=UPI003328A2F7